ncbi:hypothetical protein [uncultured Brevundimonas sp.]|uniref:hypothetical protein n=1 Tax=uncultured Brevundimonas sp. TaxID=213418 RepID=UPI0030EEAB57|tara:strand:- start:8770 stop:9213 length:444 start_codon:yes stop_codon:yes gene_type:complete
MNIPTTLARRPLVRYLAGIALCAIGGGVGAGVAAAFGSASPVGLLVTAAGGAFSMLVVAVASILWWNALDEAAQEAHKWAWWWGSTGGVAVGGVVLITLVTATREGPLPAILSGDPITVLINGVSALALFQVIGYALAWAGWWLARR